MPALRTPTLAGTVFCNVDGCDNVVKTPGATVCRPCNSRLAAERVKNRTHSTDIEQRKKALAEPVTLKCSRCSWSETVPGSKAAATFKCHRAKCAAVLAAV